MTARGRRLRLQRRRQKQAGPQDRKLDVKASPLAMPRKKQPQETGEKTVTTPLRQKGAVTAAVRRYFTDAPGVEIHVDTMVGETGYTRKQVMNAIAGLRYGSANRPGMPINPVIAGQVYRLDSEQRALRVPTGTAVKPAEKPAETATYVPASPAKGECVMKVVGDAGDHVIFLDTVTGWLWKGEVIWKP